MVPDLLSDNELAGYGAAVDQAVARRKRFDTRALGEKSPYEQSFIQCMNLWEDSPAVAPLTFHPIVCRDGSAPARSRRDPSVARSGALQGSGRAADRSASGSA